MTPNRKRKTEIGTFKEEDMRAAVMLVEEGMSLRKAAKTKGVAYQTLYRYVKKKKEQSNENRPVRMCPKYNSRQVLSSDLEKDLVDYLLTCSAMCYGLTSMDCRKLSYELAVRNQLNYPESWNINKRADGTRIFNLDETGCSTVQTPQNIIAGKGVKQSHYNAAADSWLMRNPGKTVSIYEVASLIGQAHERAFSPSNIIPGFRKTGIYLFDRNVFSDADYLVSAVTDREICLSSNSEVTDELKKMATATLDKFLLNYQIRTVIQLHKFM
ncbi:hypothetical protein ANN_19072 [Periplaneta americana]|uniref:HTH psq-type domain-containing protein n=1 Tax=Periplaneta americana TaxID=6978 RepID=A0ABQ8SQG7_PERAM|nr:hypothetical protein ANN_19072 [Periplaneta americana]